MTTLLPELAAINPAAAMKLYKRMSEAERTGFDHVILPRRLPGLALLDRYHPPPADNQPRSRKR